MYSLNQNITVMDCVAFKNDNTYLLAVGTDKGSIFYRKNWGKFEKRFTLR